MDKERIPIELNMHTKGIIVYAVPKISGLSYWILLISHVDTDDTFGVNGFHIYRHLAHCFGTGITFINKDFSASAWGYSNHYDFFLANDKEREVIKNAFKRYDVRYAKIANKLIQR